MNSYFTRSDYIREEKCVLYTLNADFEHLFSSNEEFLLQYIVIDKFNNNEFFTFSINGINNIQRPLGLFFPFYKLQNAVLIPPSVINSIFILNGIGEHKVYLCGTEFRKVII